MLSERRRADPLAIGFIGTYPPTMCGIATFTASLAKALAGPSFACHVAVVASSRSAGSKVYPPEVVAEVISGSATSRTAAAAALNELDVVVLQHEFGIYGGEDGEEVLDLLEALRIPAIVVLHTVPRRPTRGQLGVIERLAKFAEVVVVQSAASHVRLAEAYSIETSKVGVIPHGAHANLHGNVRQRSETDPAVVLTWGLLGRDKGIEWGIEAIALLRDLQPAPRYLVLGQTHPRILEKSGEEYRDSLVSLAGDLGVSDLVEFDNAYHDTRSLLSRIQTADVVLLPYRSREQVVSGVLVEALASGKPVVATAFPHAGELLAEGSGILIPYEDAEATAAALRRLLTDRLLFDRATAVARRQGRSFLWENVAERYFALAEAVAPRQPRLRGSSRRPTSGGGAQRTKELSRLDGGGADVAIGCAAGEVDRVILPSNRTLDEHDIVDVALALPRQLRPIGLSLRPHDAAGVAVEREAAVCIDEPVHHLPESPEVGSGRLAAQPLYGDSRRAVGRGLLRPAQLHDSYTRDRMKGQAT